MRCLDNNNTERNTGNQAVAPGKVPRTRAMTERHFGNRAAAPFDNIEQQVFMLWRVDTIMPARQNCDSPSVERDAVRGLIDADSMIVVAEDSHHLAAGDLVKILALTDLS